MSVITCPHPNCDKALLYGRVCCGRHWYQLDPGLQQMVSAAKSPSAKGDMRIQIREYFEARMIGPFEIVKCRGRECPADIVWMQTQRGKKMAVDYDSKNPDAASNPTADDTLYEHGRHISHFTTCRNVNDFKRNRS